MQVSVFTMGQKTKKNDIYYTRKPINWLLKIFALSYNVQHKIHFNTKGSFLRILITVGIVGLYNFTTLYKKFTNIRDLDISVSMQLMDFIQNIYDFCQYMVDIFFVYKYGREVSFEYFKQYETIDKILGSEYYYSSIRLSLARLTGFYIFIWTTSSSCDFIVWGLRTEWIVPAFYAVNYLFMFIKILTTLDLISHVMHIECRLRIMGDLMQYFHTSAECVLLPKETSKVKWFHCNTSVILFEIEKHFQRLKSHSLNGYNELNWLIRCYLVLAEQSAFVNTMCGTRVFILVVIKPAPQSRKNLSRTREYLQEMAEHIGSTFKFLWFSRVLTMVLVRMWSGLKEKAPHYGPTLNKLFDKDVAILLNSTSLLISMVTYSNLAVGLIIIGSKKTEDVLVMAYFPAVSSVMRLATCAALFISMVHYCERVYRQRERIICIIDHMLYTKNLSADLIATLKDFRGLVQTRPIYFHMANLVRLQYSLLVSTASVVVTYTIILLQNTI